MMTDPLKDLDKAELEFRALVLAILLWANSNGMPLETIDKMLKSTIDIELQKMRDLQ